MKKFDGWFAVIFGVFFIAAVCLVIGKGIWDTVGEHSALQKGDVHYVQVSDKEINETKKGEPPMYKINVQDGDGTRVITVDKSVYEKVKKGDDLPVVMYEDKMLVKD